MFDYEKFIQTYAATADGKNFVAWFTYPDERGVWAPECSGAITGDGVIELMNQDAQGNILIISIRHW